MSTIPSLDRIKIFADGASLPSMLESARDPRISGFTTNPTLMRKAGISDYRAFAKEVLASIKDRPISFEVFADEFADMRRQAQDIATWGDNVYVKIPITNTRREPATALIRELASSGVKLNVTAICTLDPDVITVASPIAPSRARTSTATQVPTPARCVSAT